MATINLAAPKQVLHPAYYNSFHCIGGACENNCCAEGWNITIDKRTYLKYKQIKDKQFAETMRSCIRRQRGENASDYNYAIFVMDGHKSCPYQTEDKWCTIHANYGPEYLCVTCRVYPRILSAGLPEFAELSLVMSCPEVVRRVLQDPAPITFQLSDYNELVVKKENLGTHPPKAFTRPKGAGNTFRRQAWAVRESIIDILQMRQYPLTERLLIVGLMLRKLTEQQAEGKLDAAAAIAAMYVDQAKAGKLAGLNMGAGDNEQLRKTLENLIMQLITTMSQKRGDSSKPYQRFIQNVIHEQGIGQEPDENDKVTLKPSTFLSTRTHLFDAFLDEKSYVLEHYFVNFVFTHHFPYRFEELTPYEHFLILVEQYALLRALLCGAANLEEGITQQHIVDCIVGVSHTFEHSVVTPREVTQKYVEKGIDGLLHMAILLHG